MQESSKKLPGFDAPDLAREVENLTSAQLDSLPFGVIGLDANGIVRVFNKAEREISGFKDRAAQGRSFFVDVAPCMDNGYFKGRIDHARKAGSLNISFTFVGDFEDRDREISVRAQAARDGGIWIFHQRK
ncbi:MAG: PAS domain-containing protein [Methylocystis sp.]